MHIFDSYLSIIKLVHITKEIYMYIFIIYFVILYPFSNRNDTILF